MRSPCPPKTSTNPRIHKTRRILPGKVISLATAFLVLLLTNTSPANHCQAAEKQPAPHLATSSKNTNLNLQKKIQVSRESTPATQEKIAVQDDRIQRLQEGIIEHKVKILNTQVKERSILSELEKIDLTMAAKKKNLAVLNKASEEQEKLLIIKQQDIEKITAEKKVIEEHVKKRLAAYYRTGPISLLNVIFSSDSLPDILTNQEYFQILLQYDKKTISSYLATINELKQAREEHLSEKKRLLDLAEQLKNEREELAATRKTKKVLLTRVKTEKSLYKQAADEIEKAANDLAETLQKIKLKAGVPEPEQPAPSSLTTQPIGNKQTTTFSGRKGTLLPPVSGTVVTSFGSNETEKFGVITVAKGIDIKTTKGAKIKAVYSGKVISSGYMRGYGNMLIIDHGQRYYSVVSRAEEFYKTDGDRIKEGEIIGIMGEDSTLIGEGLHFEIRNGSNPEDPLAWLDKTKLKLKTDPKAPQ